MALVARCEGPQCDRVTKAEWPSPGWLIMQPFRADPPRINQVPGTDRHFCSWPCVKAKAYCLESGDNCK